MEPAAFTPRLSPAALATLARHVAASAAALMGLPDPGVVLPVLGDELLRSLAEDKATRILLVSLSFEANQETVGAHLDCFNLNEFRNFVIFVKRRPTLAEPDFTGASSGAQGRDASQRDVLGFLDVMSSHSATFLEFFRGVMSSTLVPCSETITGTIGTTASRTCSERIAAASGTMSTLLAQLSSEFKITIPRLTTPPELQAIVDRAQREGRPAALEDIPNSERCLGEEDSNEFRSLVEAIKTSFGSYEKQIKALVANELDLPAVSSAYQLISFYDDKREAMNAVLNDADAQRKLAFADLVMERKSNTSLLISRKNLQIARTSLQASHDDLASKQISNLKGLIEGLRKIDTVEELIAKVAEINERLTSMSTKVSVADRSGEAGVSSAVQTYTLIAMCYEDILTTFIRIIFKDNVALLDLPFADFEDSLTQAVDFLETTNAKIITIEQSVSGRVASLRKTSELYFYKLMKMYKGYNEFLGNIRILERKLHDLQDIFATMFRESDDMFGALMEVSAQAKRDIRQETRNISKDTVIALVWNNIFNRIDPKISNIERSISGTIRKKLEAAAGAEEKYEVFVTYRSFLHNSAILEIVKPHQMALLELINNQLAALCAETNQSFDGTDFAAVARSYSSELSASMQRLAFILNIDRRLEDVESQLEIVFGEAWFEDKLLEASMAKIYEILETRSPIKTINSILEYWRKRVSRSVDANGIFMLSLAPVAFNRAHGCYEAASTSFSQFGGDYQLIKDFQNTRHWARITSLPYLQAHFKRAQDEFAQNLTDAKGVLDKVELHFERNLLPILRSIGSSLATFHLVLQRLDTAAEESPSPDFASRDFLVRLVPPFMAGSPEAAQLVLRAESDVLKEIRSLAAKPICVAFDTRTKDNMRSPLADTPDDSRLPDEVRLHLKAYLETRSKLHEHAAALEHGTRRLYDAMMAVTGTCERIDFVIEGLATCPFEDIGQHLRTLNSLLGDGLGLEETDWGSFEKRGRTKTLAKAAQAAGQTPLFYFAQKLHAVVAGVLRARMLHTLDAYTSQFEGKPLEQDSVADWPLPACWLTRCLAAASERTGLTARHSPPRCEVVLQHDKSTDNIVANPPLLGLKQRFFQGFARIVADFASLPPLSCDVGHAAPRSFEVLGAMIPVHLTVRFSQAVHGLVADAGRFALNWADYKKLWALRPDAVAPLFGDDLARWEQFFADLLNDRRNLFATKQHAEETGADSFERGPLSVSSTRIQGEIRQTLDTWIAELLGEFGHIVAPMTAGMCGDIDRNRQALEEINGITLTGSTANASASVTKSAREDTTRFLTVVSEVIRFYETSHDRITKLVRINGLAKELGYAAKVGAGQAGPPIESIKSNFNALHFMLERKLEVMKNSVDALYETLKAEDADLKSKADRYARKWAAIKPGSVGDEAERPEKHEKHKKHTSQETLEAKFEESEAHFSRLLTQVTRIVGAKQCLDAIVDSMSTKNSMLRPIGDEQPGAAREEKPRARLSRIDLVVVREKTADAVATILEEIRAMRELLKSISAVQRRMDEAMRAPLATTDVDRLHAALEEMDRGLGEISARSSSLQLFQDLREGVQQRKDLERFLRLLRDKIFKAVYWQQYAAELTKYHAQTRASGSAVKGRLELLRRFVSDPTNSDYTVGDALALLDRPGSPECRILGQVFESARGEASLKGIIKGIEAFVSTYEITLVDALAARGQCKLITGWDDLNTKLDDSISTLQSMHNSPYYAAGSAGASSIKAKVERYEARIQSLVDLFSVWAEVQRKWIHLQGVFVVFNNNPTLASQLSDEISTMNLTNKEFIQVMKDLEQASTLQSVVENMNPFDQALKAAGTNTSQYVLTHQMTEILGRLTKIQKSLGRFLESQRNSFPRLYFVGDDDLLEIISVTNKNDITRINRHMRKMFAGVGELLVASTANAQTGKQETTALTGVRSIHGEEILFPVPVPVATLRQPSAPAGDSVDVHILLETVEALVFNRIRLVTLENVAELRKLVELPACRRAAEGLAGDDVQEARTQFRRALLEWLVATPVQCALLALNMLWTQLVEAAIGGAAGGSLAPILGLVGCLLDVLSTSDSQDLLALHFGEDALNTAGDTQVRASFPNFHMFASYRSLVVADLIHMRESTRYLAALVEAAPDKHLTQYMFDKSSTLRYYQDQGEPFFYNKLKAVVAGLERHYKAANAPPEMTTLLAAELAHGHITVRMGEASIPYGYEYVGSESRIVQTPLTDKCYYTLMQALHYKLGGSPFGPAGTGKTESVKALGILLGRFVLVFNCDENFDDSAMGRIFVGLCQVGAFCCLDEFNRLTEASLSAVSQQILAIQTSLKESRPVHLLEQDIPINANVGIFITTNPTYAGRNQLPDNLKGLFRSVAMIEPDKQLIAQVMLFSQGFLEAERLSRQIVPLFRLCGEQLSSQPHYDWGLRALKAVLTAAGKQKRTEVEAAKRATRGDPAGQAAALASLSSHEAEQRTIVQALQTSILPKLVASDTPLFSSLLQDLYPGIDIRVALDPRLLLAIDAAVLKNGFVPYDEWLTKIHQLHLTTSAGTTSGTMLVGPSGSGKTASFLTLVSALRHFTGRAVHFYTICPKSIDKDELYGSLDAMTREWRDGVFTSILRRVIESNANGLEGARSAAELPLYFIIFDGSVDPVWVENLNSVLDDNKTLTLPSGERLNLPPNCHLLFEVLDLAHATLATVSRCNMIYYSDSTLRCEHPLLRELRVLRHLDICSMVNFGADGTVPGIGQGAGTANVFSERFVVDVTAEDVACAAEGRPVPTNANPLNSPNKTRLEQVLAFQNAAIDSVEPFFAPLFAQQTAPRQSVFAADTPNPYTLLVSPFALVAGAVTELCRHHDIMEHTDARICTTVKTLLLSSMRDFYRHYEDANQPHFLADRAAIRDFMAKRLLLAVTWGFCSSLGNEGRVAVAQRLADELAGLVARRVDLAGLVHDVANGKHKALLAAPGTRALLYGQLGGADTFADTLRSICAAIPSTGSLLDVHVGLERYSPGAGYEWVSWYDVVQGSFGNDANSITENDVGLKVISTIDTARHGFLISSWLAMHAPLLLCGPAGSGKSMSLEATLRGMADYMHAGVNFSSCTSPDIIRQYLARYCKRTTTTSGPVMTIGAANVAIRNLVLFCDEINLPAEDAFGTQRVIAFIRSIVELGGYWDPADNQFVRLENIHFSGACNPPTDPGRQELSSRFLRHAPVLLVDYPTEESLYMIYNCFNRAVLSRVTQCKEMAQETSTAMIQTYMQTKRRLTPNKQPHYIYSPRELTRWTRALKTCFDSTADRGMLAPEELMKIVFHEGMRLFHDRIVDVADKAWTRDLIYNSVAAAFPRCSVEAAIGPVCASASIMYSQWLSGDRYEQVDRGELRRFVEKRLKDFRNEVLNIDVVVFDEMLEHLLRIERVLRQPIGHVLLAGDSGSGKTLLARFAAFINGYEYIEINTYKGYSLDDFEDELRRCMKQAGIQGKSVVFAFDESNALDTSFTEHMNALLAAGDVVGLFEDEEAAKLFGEIREKLPTLLGARGHKGGAPDVSPLSSDDELYEWFKGRVRRNLHVVFTMNPPRRITVDEEEEEGGGDEMQAKAATSPALFNRCVVDWIGNWGLSHVFQVATHKFRHLDLADFGEPPADQQPAAACAGADTQLVAVLSDPGVPAQAQLDALVQGVAQMPLRFRASRACAAIHRAAQEEADELARACAGRSGAGVLAGSSQRLATPRHFMAFLRVMTGLWKRKEESRLRLAEHTVKGLRALDETERRVNDLRLELAEKGKILRDALAAADTKLQEMLKEQTAAEARKREAEVVAGEVAAKREEIAVRKSAALSELSEVEPLVQKALQSVQSINKRDLDELRALGRPPDGVRLALEAVCIILGKIKTGGNWDDIRKIIRSDTFIPSIVNFKTREELTPKLIKQVGVYVENPNFTEEQVLRASKAAGPMVGWVKSQMKYAEIVGRVEPLRREVANLEAEADEKGQHASRLQAEISGLEGRISQYRSDYTLLIQKAEGLKVEMKAVEVKVERAAKLVGSLSGEKSRWERQRDEWERDAVTFAGDMILSSAYTAYCGAYAQDTRVRLVGRWQEILEAAHIGCCPTLIIHEFLSSADDRDTWLSNGLPNDDLSIANAAVLMSSEEAEDEISLGHQQRPATLPKKGSTPLLIDPSGQAIAWLQRQLGERLNRSSFLSPTFTRTLEQAVRLGQTLLVEDVEHLDPVVNPLLDIEALTSATAGRTVVRLGTKEIDYSPGFRLLLATRDSTVQLAPALSSRCTILNYTVTQASLCSQCLNMILQHECPEVGSQRLKLLQEEREFVTKLRGLETQLLEILNESGGNILDSEEVAKTLERVKREATEAEAKRAEAVMFRERLDSVSHRYQYFAHAASALYFLVARLSGAHFSLFFTLSFYTEILVAAIGACALAAPGDTRDGGAGAGTGSDAETVRRMVRVINELSARLFATIGCATPTSLRLPFALALIHTLRGTARAVCDSSEYGALYSNFTMISQDAEAEATIDELLVNGAAAGDVASPTAADEAGFSPAVAHTLNRSQFGRLRRTLAGLPETAAFARQLADREQAAAILASPFKLVDRLKEALRPSLAAGARGDLVCSTACLIASRAVFPQCFEQCANDFVSAFFGHVADNRAFLAGCEAVTLQELSETFGARYPLLLLSSGGFDATQKVVNLASTTATPIVNMPVGASDCTPLTIARTLSDCARRGAWLLISNLHLAPAAFVTDILVLCRDKLDTRQDSGRAAGAAGARGAHARFRVLLTANLTPTLPPALFQATVRLVEEAPPGLATQISRALALLEPGKKAHDAPAMSLETTYRARLSNRVLFLLCILHGILAQRAKYVPIGWLKDHEISTADFLAATSVARSWLASSLESDVPDSSRVPFEAIREILEATCYGGKIHAASDRRILGAFATHLISPAALEEGFSAVIGAGTGTGSGSGPAGLSLPSIEASFADYRAFVSSLEPVEPPEFIGLTSAAKAIRMGLEGRHSIAVFGAIVGDEQAGHSAGASVSGEQHQRLVDDWLAHLAEAEQERAVELDAGSDDPLVRCVARESTNLAALFATLHDDLVALGRMLGGETLPTNRTTALMQALTLNTIPSLWVAATPYNIPLGLSCAAFVRDACARLRHIRGVAGCLGKGLFHSTVWLGGLCHPRAFLTALRQKTARLTHTPLEDLAVCVVLGGDAGEHSVSISGCCLACCALDGSCLAPSEHPEQPIPSISLAYLPARRPLRHPVPVPVFYDSSRADLIFEVEVEGRDGVPQAYWCTRGVAITIWNAE